MDFLGSLAKTSVDTIVWATVGSGAARSCLPKEMCKNLDLEVKPVEEKVRQCIWPASSGAWHVQRHGDDRGRKEAHKSKEWVGGKTIAVSLQAG